LSVGSNVNGSLVRARVFGADWCEDVGNARTIGAKVDGAEVVSGDETVGKLVGTVVKGREISGDRVAVDNIPGEDVEGVDLLWFVGDDVDGATLDAKDLIVGASVG
jgi:hypothetical protein